MNQEGKLMTQGKALILGLSMAVMTACASGGGPAPEGATGNRPVDSDETRAASVHLVQAGLAEGDEAQALMQEAMTDALAAIEQQPENPKAYLVAGQAAVGLHDWVRADTMFEQAVELYPPYQEDITVERESGWVEAYNMGVEALNAGDTERAIRMFEGADLLYQDRPEALLALGSLQVNQGDLEAAVDAYTSALEILSGDPPEGMSEDQIADWEQSRQTAAFNAAELLAQTGEYQRAADVLQGYLSDNEAQLDQEMRLRAQTALAGFLAQAGEAEQAEAMYEEILQRTDLSPEEYFQVGIGFFNTGDYQRAAEAFATAAEMNPYSRDAQLNLVQSLYSYALELEQQEETPERNEELMALYDQILESAVEVRELDPLNRNLLSFMLRAYRAKADLSDAGEAQELTTRTQELYRVYQNQEYELQDIRLTLGGADGRVQGTFVNLAGPEGESVTINFEVLDSTGQVIDQADIVVDAPAAGESTTFSAPLSITGDYAGWQYEIVE